MTRRRGMTLWYGVSRYLFIIVALLIPAVVSAAQGTLNNGETLGTIRGKLNSNFTELYSKTAIIDANGSVTIPAGQVLSTPTITSTAADGEHYILPYNSTAFSGTPTVGMFQTTPTGPEWYNGTAWEGLLGGASSLSELSDWPEEISANELGYLDGVTSSIQTQLSTALQAPTVQASDPTSVSAVGWYLATGSGDTFYKTSTGLFNASAGTYTADPTNYLLTVTDPGSGHYIVCNDADLGTPINCGNGGTACTSSAPSDAAITGCVATGAAGYGWASWTGDFTGADGNSGAVTMTAAKTGSATFVDILAPTLASSPVISGALGTTFTITYSEAVAQGTGYVDTDLNIDCTTAGNDIGLTYLSGNNTTTHVYTIASGITPADTCNFDWAGTADGLEDTNGGSNDLAAIVSNAVVNSSTLGQAFIHDLLLDDNAATTAVANTGTSGLNWVANVATNTLYNDSIYPVGSASSFFFGAAYNHIKSGENWTSEKFETTFYIRHTSAVAAVSGPIMQIGNGDHTISANEFYIRRSIGSDEFYICAQGATGSSSCQLTTDYNPVADTWYKLTVTVDATTNPWSIVLKRDETTITMAGSFAADAATFNSKMWLGADLSVASNAYFSTLKVVDQTP